MGVSVVVMGVSVGGICVWLGSLSHSGVDDRRHMKYFLVVVAQVLFMLSLVILLLVLWSLRG